MLLNNRYELLNELGRGGMGVVYRAQDRLSGQVVALKQVRIPQSQLDFGSKAMTEDSDDLRLALAQEFRTMAALRHPHIVSVLDYGFAEKQQPFFTMELLDEPRTLLEATTPLKPVARLELMLQVLEALKYLHQRHLLHRDLKPANILVTKGNQVKLVDFGLAMMQDAAEDAAGTFGYMPPEVFEKKPMTMAGDLFAVGVLLHQIMVGTLPFPLDNLRDHLLSLLAGLPNLDKLTATAPDIKGGQSAQHLMELVTSLLEFEPTNRPASAVEVQRQLRAYLGILENVETTEIRDSYLTTAPLVGRAKELQQFTTAIDNSLAGQSEWWLIGGESGVGKSRLLEEVRIQALVKNIQVWQGQAVAEGGLPFHLWRNLLRNLVLQVQLSELEASILKEIVPDIADLLGYPVVTIPPINDRLQQDRLVLTIVEVCKRLVQPTLLVLEDLQWTHQSLLPLQEMVKVREQLPQLMIIGTYRTEERPELPTELAEFEVLSLSRLERDSIAELSGAMLGEAGQNPELVEFLATQTEGNTFFMVEVMRFLAEESGRLSAIGQLEALPQQILTGGMQALLQRRLAKIPAMYQSLMQHAAIIGRAIDEALLRQILPEADITDWLYQAEAAAVLSVTADNRWQFTHDKLREALGQTLSPEIKSNLHEAVAEAIEAIYPTDASYNTILLEHWHQAGNLDKEIHYLNPVAEQLIKITADYDGGRTLLERGRAALPVMDGRQVSLGVWLAIVLRLQGNTEQSQLILQQTLQLAEQHDNQLGIVECLNALGVLAKSHGNYEQALDYYQRGLAIGQMLENQDAIALSLNDLGTIADQQSNYEQARGYYQQSLVIRQTIDDQSGIASSLNNLAIIMFRQGKSDQALDYFQRSLAIRQTIGDQNGIARSFNNLSALAFIQDNYEQAMNYVQQSLAINQSIGSHIGILQCLNNLGFGYLKLGSNQAQTTFRQALVIAYADGFLPYILEILLGYARIFLNQGNPIRGGELVGLAKHHPAFHSQIEVFIDELLPELEEVLSSEELRAAMARGKVFDLDTVVQKLLEEFGEEADVTQ